MTGSGHPNTVAAIIAGFLGTLTAYLLKKYASIDLTLVQAGGIVTGYTAVLLFVGRRGLKGTFQAVWNGVWNGAPKPTPVTVVLPPSEPPATP